MKTIIAEDRQAITDDSQRKCVRWRSCKNDEATTERVAVSTLTHTRPSDVRTHVFMGSPHVHVWIVPVCGTACKALVAPGLMAVMEEGRDLSGDSYQAAIQILSELEES